MVRYLARPSIRLVPYQTFVSLAWYFLVLGLSCLVMMLSGCSEAKKGQENVKADEKNVSQCDRDSHNVSRSARTGGQNGEAKAACNQEERLFERLQHSLFIATDAGSMMEDAFEDDERTFFSGTSVGGCLYVYVNDSPMRLQCRGSSIFHIYDFLVPGRNRIRIEGSHTTRMFVKAVTIDPRTFKDTLEVEEVLGKAWLEPSQKSVTLEFDAKITKVPDYEDLPDDPKAIARMRQELQSLVVRWIECCRSHDVQGFSESWMPRLKSPPPYLSDASRPNEVTPFVKGLVGSETYALVTKANEVQMIFGKRSVLLYTSIKKDQGAPFGYLFEFKSSNKDSTFIEPVTLARLEGKWVGVR